MLEHFCSQTKTPTDVALAVTSKLIHVDLFEPGDLLHNKPQIMKFIPLITMGMGSSVGGIGFDEESIHRRSPEDGLDLRRMPEGHGSPDGDVQIEHQEKADLASGAAVAMHDAAGSRKTFATQDVIESIVGFDGVNHEGQVELTGDAELCDEGRLLELAPGPILDPVKIQPELAETAPILEIIAQVPAQLVKFFIEPWPIMAGHGPGMQSRRRPDTRSSGQFPGEASPSAIVTGDDQPSKTDLASEVDGLFAIVVEGFEVQMTMGVEHVRSGSQLEAREELAKGVGLGACHG